MQVKPEIIGYRRNGTPIRVIRGGAEDTGGAATGSEGTSEATGAPAGGENTPKGSEGQEDGKKGPAGGVDALKADLVGERQARQKIATEFDQFKTQFAQAFAALTGQKVEKGAPTAETLAEQLAALQAKLDEKDQAATQRVIRSEAKSIATGLGFHDPADALSQIDISKIEVKDGEVDSAALKVALENVAKAKPYLLKVAGTSAVDVGIGGTGSPAATKKGRARLEDAYNTKN